MSTRFTALTIKQGDAFLLEDDGWNCLFDSGFTKSIVNLLKYKGINKLDLAICSHNDADHANGFIALLESGFQIDEIWLPGLWASILQFVKDNCNRREEIECNNENYENMLDSLFLEESEATNLESFNQTLSFFARQVDDNDSHRFFEDLHEKLTDYVILNPEILAQYIVDNLPKDLNDDLYYNVTDDAPRLFIRDLLRREWLISKSPALDRLTTNGSFNKTDWIKFFQETFQNESDCHHAKLGIAWSFKIKLKRIMELAGLAYQNGCTIRWFEPRRGCVTTPRTIEHGFLALNSYEVSKLKKIKSPLTYLFALSLSAENRYSLVYEYWKNHIPVIRFSADSRITCQSRYPYPENIIVTAPHHGSAANAVVYQRLQGNDIIWVRSDWQSSERPCIQFKDQPNKYCLACDNFNFISEICFEYNTWDKKWHHVRGEQCRCIRYK